MRRFITLLLMLPVAACAQIGFGPSFLAASANITPVTVSTNPLALWDMEDASSPAVDSISSIQMYERDGTFTWHNANPKVGTYNIFNTGDSSLVLTNLASSLLVPSGGSMTAMGWFQATTAATTSHTFGRWDTTIGRAWTIRNDSGTWKFLASSDGSTSTEVGTTAVTTSYQFVVGVFDNAADLIKISVNGGTFETAAFTGNLSQQATVPVAIGGRTASGVASASFGGRIDQLRFFPRAISQAEVAYYYNGGTGR